MPRFFSAFRFTLYVTFLTLPCAIPTYAEELNAKKIITDAMNNMRGVSSYAEISMTIQRKSWQRSMAMQAWTAGEKQSLVRIITPKKDAGNATLIDDKSMWSYAPKINRVIKVPSSMMGQSWMGSDFSNKDISRSTEIINDYTHTLDISERQKDHTVYTITSTPKEDSAIVWGKEVLTIRDDFVILKQEYWDQDNQLVKVMETQEVAEMGGRQVAKTLRMYNIDSPNEWTQITNQTIEFDIALNKNFFTLSNLRNPR